MLLRSISMHAKVFSDSFNKTASITKKLTTIALLTTLSAILQSAGGFIPVAGLFISPFATAPVIISTTLSEKYGVLGYLLTIFLLVLIQPSEVLIFTFTTGLLGIGIGLAYHVWKRRLSLIISGAIALLSGILIVLLVFQFPLLGPSIQPTIDLPLFFSLAFFSFFYSWFWVELSVFLFKRLKR
ncbi:DUF2232 domain-containing protein [Metabacillus litoralis]|uniref:DUF2232 domain-containing protein n=1 Tax=Metabacillus litoralis TaxID=152268 RepID=UPI00204079AE|nr:DUF2232 domain-containing protein [Metabacillus litoralis]MCM3653769.1 YybS family protein [Metabacillus litoralis]